MTARALDPHPPAVRAEFCSTFMYATQLSTMMSVTALKSIGVAAMQRIKRVRAAGSERTAVKHADNDGAPLVVMHVAILDLRARVRAASEATRGGVRDAP